MAKKKKKSRRIRQLPKQNRARNLAKNRAKVAGLAALLKVEALRQSMEAIIARVVHVEDIAGVQGDGAIVVGRYGKRPFRFNEGSTVRFNIEESGCVMDAAKARWIDVRMANGVLILRSNGDMGVKHGRAHAPGTDKLLVRPT